MSKKGSKLNLFSQINTYKKVCTGIAGFVNMEIMCVPEMCVENFGAILAKEKENNKKKKYICMKVKSNQLRDTRIFFLLFFGDLVSTHEF